MPTTNHINFGDGLSVVDEGGGEITVNAGGGGTGGGGIQFDIYPQAGGWLYAETDDETGSPSGFGLELSDYSTGGAFLGALGGGDLQLKTTGGGRVRMTSTGGITISDSSHDINVSALNNTLTLGGKGAYLLDRDPGGVALVANLGAGTDQGVYLRLENDKLSIHRRATGDPTAVGTEWLVIDFTGGGSYHMLTGATWGSRPVTATERFKMLLANALERVCVLEDQLEQAQARIVELEVGSSNGSHPTSDPVTMQTSN